MFQSCPSPISFISFEEVRERGWRCEETTQINDQRLGERLEATLREWKPFIWIAEKQRRCRNCQVLVGGSSGREGSLLSYRTDLKGKGFACLIVYSFGGCYCNMW